MKNLSFPFLLKELLKQNLISQTSSKEITEKNLIGKNEKEPKNSLEIKNENITKNSEITVNEYPEP